MGMEATVKEATAVEMTATATAARELAEILREKAVKGEIAEKRAIMAAREARKATKAEATEKAAADVATEAVRIEALKTDVRKNVVTFSFCFTGKMTFYRLCFVINW